VRTGACDDQRVLESLSIPARFNGPLDSGNGGYSAGLIAGFMGGAAEVDLRRPVPLDTRLDVVREAEGSVRVLDGGALVAEARPAPGLEVEVPDPVDLRHARLARDRYRGLDDGVFCRCFVCGRARADGLGVFAGEVEGRGLVASPWTPPSWTADAEGRVREEFVWGVLDCPTFFGAYVDDDLGLSVLARFAARVDAPVLAGSEHVVIGWPIGVDGRKRRAGSALLSSDGEVLAAADALLIELRQS
jgi:hypothetical protein